MANVKNHLVGIVPLSHLPYDFETPWHESLMPIGQNYLALERSVVECAYAGCSSIWIVLDRRMTPLIRNRLRDWIFEPRSLVDGQFGKFPSLRYVRIPIYYIGIHPKHVGKRESIPWSIIYGAKMSTHVCGKISAWLTPKRFFVSFPYGIYPARIVDFHRRVIQSDSNFCVKYTDNNKTTFEPKNGDQLAFTFGQQDLKEFFALFRRMATGKFDTTQPPEERVNGIFPTKLLPIEERYSGKHITMKDIMEASDWEADYSIEAPFFYPIDSWDKYRRAIGSFHFDKLRRPAILKRNGDFSGVGINDIDDEQEEE